MSSAHALIFDISRLNQRELDQRDKLHVTIQSAFGVIPGRYFLQHPQYAVQHIETAFPKKKRTSTQDSALSELKQFAHQL